MSTKSSRVNGSVKRLACCGIFVAIGIVLSAIDISHLNLEIISLALFAMMFDVRSTVLVAVLSDVVGYMVLPSGGAFNFGFALSSVLTALLFSLMFSGNVRPVRIVLAVAANSVFILWLLNSYWLHLVSGSPYLPYLTVRGPKILIMMCVTSAILIIFSKRSDILKFVSRKN